ncbi:MAG: ethanolamine ammonia-lyase reactivating factor EutA [Alphaproteobacteria bacterium]
MSNGVDDELIMHELEFDHGHMTPEQQQAIADVIWAADNVELKTVGVDIGSSTSHLMFSRVHLQRLTTALSSRFVVVGREVLWRSPILLTPYKLDDNTIDVEKLSAFIDGAYKEAGLTRDDIDSGAVILTGEALKRNNAEAITHLFAGETGKFVTASAGHHLECAMAAHGSGAVALSRREKACILNIDIGGGTTKLGLVEKGQLLQTTAFEVGGRLIAFDAEGRIVRLEGPALKHAAQAGVKVEKGLKLSDEDKAKICDVMADVLVAHVMQRDATGHAQDMLVTEPLPKEPVPVGVTFSGGVSEFIYGRETSDYGDLGKFLADAIVRRLKAKTVPYKIYDPGAGIRATVIGASQFSVQVSGNTISISNHNALPLRNVPVLSPKVSLATDEISAKDVEDAIRKAFTRFDFQEGETAIALALRWEGDPLHARIKAVADGIVAALPKTAAGAQPLVLMLDGDIGKTLGVILKRECDVQADIVSVDGVSLKEFDYVDIGEMIRPTNVVPLVIKSLLFSSPGVLKK